MSSVIKVENLSKQYRLGEISTGAITHDINRWWHRIRGKENPYLKIGEANDRTEKGNSDYVWSLRDINFEIKQGDAVGIIGRNGAGKSTLLKILSKVTQPTTGTIKTKGRIASLLEVGTGFHPDLSGRDNIFLNGAILGMRKAEISRKFDEIVDFAGVERYIDTPVKRYSSGMYVRLAFAVAAYLESEILIVDEVLAVGDAEFQKKCLGKMGDISKGEGRTVLFVSHNMSSIEQLCSMGVFLKNGIIGYSGAIDKVLKLYLAKESKTKINFVEGKNLDTIINPFIINAEIDEESLLVNKLILKAEFRSNVLELVEPSIGVVISDYQGIPIFGTNSRMHKSKYISKKCKSGLLTLVIGDLPLLPGEYNVSLFLGDSMQDYEGHNEALTFEIKQNQYLDSTKLPDAKFIGSVNIKNAEWTLDV